jgi:cytochrome c biogenesis protein CcmG/thiol:disulfide interchange protein DsbE
MKMRFIFPLIIFFLVGLTLWRGLGMHPNEIPSPLINKPAPDFQVTTLEGSKKLSNQDFFGHVSLLNVWATWCEACAAEHEFLLGLANDKNLYLYGLDYKDDASAAKKLLSEKGNPYRSVGVDLSGDTAINWGVYGTPETFVIDKKGIIRYKQIGALTADNWENVISPLIAKLEKES